MNHANVGLRWAAGGLALLVLAAVTVMIVLPLFSDAGGANGLDALPPQTSGAIDPDAAAALPFKIDPMHLMDAWPLEEEPAGLPAYEGARLQLRFMRTEGTREEVSAWRIQDASLNDVADFYENNAAAAGFRRLGTAPDLGQDTSERTLPFYGVDSRTGQVLTLRLTDRADSIHVLIHLTHPAGR